MSTSNNTLLLFIHGGPGLSSDYMNNFTQLSANTLGDSIDCINLQLPNHHENVVKSIDKDNFSQELVQSINEKSSTYKNTFIVCHSFAGSVALKSKKLLNGTLILLSSILTPIQSVMFKDRVNDIASTNSTFTDEIGFKKYMLDILPAYFNQNFKIDSEVKESIISNTSWVLNSNLLGDDTYKNNDKSLIKGTYYIYGDSDLLLKSSEQNDMIDCFEPEKVFQLSNCGHFPMIEKPNELITCLVEIISNNSTFL